MSKVGGDKFVPVVFFAEIAGSEVVHEPSEEILHKTSLSKARGSFTAQSRHQGLLPQSA